MQIRYRPLFLIFLTLTASGCSLVYSEPPIFVPPVGHTPTAADPKTPTVMSAYIPETTEVEAEPTSLPVQAASPVPQPTETLVPTPDIELEPIVYQTQAGDTLDVVATHFGVRRDQIRFEGTLPENSFINPGTRLVIPQVLINTTSGVHLLPDSEFVNSRAVSDSDFPADLIAFVEEAGGYLSRPHEYDHSMLTNGAEIVLQIAENNSVNPYLLLALLEYESHWVFGEPQNLAELKYPMGHIKFEDEGLVNQLRWAVNQLSIGYYGWREGRLTEIYLGDDRSSENVTARIDPTLNAGTVALQYYFSKHYDSEDWILALDENAGFMATYRSMFGSPANRQEYEPLFSYNLNQPEMILPFTPGTVWNYTGGPHGAWEGEGSWSAIDFAPSGFSGGCSQSYAYVTASAPGLVIKAENAIIELDLDGDGDTRTGWVLLYLHIAENGMRVEENDWVQHGDKLGHPSCEGGIATGTHVHMARKYNGEWMAANGPIAFVLSGWTAHNGGKPYAGTLTKDGTTINASSFSAPGSQISR
jgi:LasA protease